MPVDVHITPQTVITAGAVLGAILAIGATVFKIYDWYKKQNAQDSRLDNLEQHHNQDIKAIKDEQTVLVYGVLACLKGLQEQGCNGPVTKAIEKLEKHLNIEAHR